MHRFRKKSDAKRAQVPEHLLAGSQPPPSPNQRDTTAEIPLSLPPASDFRTSLILPSLSRRFTLLRDSNGEPVSIDDVRSKLAEQRARGADHHITEEEEEMIVQALGEIRTANSGISQVSNPMKAPYTAPSSLHGDGVFASQQDMKSSDYTSSIRSGMTPSVPSTPSSASVYPGSSPSSLGSRAAYRYNSSKRNSNNMFGSHRFHDTSYLHSVKAGISSRSTSSLAGSDSQGGSMRSLRSLQMSAAENSGVKPPVSNGEGGDVTANQDKGPDFASHSVASPSKSPPKEFTPQQMGRTALALDEVIRGIEEEQEETIMIPRRSVSRAGTINSRAQSPKPNETSTAGTPIPWMTDEPRVDDRDLDDDGPVAVTQPATSSPLAQAPISAPSKTPSPSPLSYRPGTTSPTPRLPGYIPGMPRPVTPRDIDSDRDDGLTGYSTTPRARSPAYPMPSSHPSHSTSLSLSPRHHHHSSISSETQTQAQSILPPSILRSSRGSGTVPPLRTTSPALGSRSRGNSVSGAQVPSPLPSPGPDERFKSDFMMRRPLSPPYGASAGYSISRPGTPSAGLWPSTSPLAQAYSSPPINRNESPRPEANLHMRNGSLASSDSHNDALQRNGSFGNYPGNPPWLNGPSRNGFQDTSIDSSISSIELGHPLHSPYSSAAAKIAARVPTPVSSNNRARSPVNTEPVISQDPILLNRVLSKRGPRRMQTPPPHSPTPVLTPSSLQTPPSSSNSSSNGNLLSYPSPPPMFSPLLNTSTTSLLSTSSGYHSLSEEKAKNNGWEQLIVYDTRTDWRAMLDNANGEVNGLEESDMEEPENPEQIVKKILGVTKKDLVDMQTRLVEDAVKRNLDHGTRSPLRKRRVSGSRASLPAVGRDSRPTSPAPPPRQPTPVADTPSPTVIPDHRSRALLDSVLSSIQSESNTSSAISTTLSTVEASDAPTVEPQSTTDDDSSSKPPSATSSQSEIREGDSSARLKALFQAIEVQEKPRLTETQPEIQDASPVSPVVEPVYSDSGEATEVPPARQWRSPTVVIPPPVNVQLHREVSRKAAEATAALKSRPHIRLGESEGTVRRKPIKRIDLQQISNPQFISSTTSVNALPLPNPLAVTSPKTPTTAQQQLERSSSTRFTDRFKRLKGTLRTKPSSRDGSEITPFIIPTNSPLAVQSTTSISPSTPSAQTVHYIPQRHEVPATASTVEQQTRAKATVPTPPASAGPGLKGFISLFRKSRKDIVGSPSESSSQQSPAAFIRNEHGPGRVSSVSRPSFSKPRRSEDLYSVNAYPRSPTPARSPTPDSYARSPTRDPTAVDQLLNAASQLGIDKRDLDDLLARSTSRSSRNTTWTQASAPAFESVNAPPVPMSKGDNVMDQSRSVDSGVKSHLRTNPVNRYQEGEVVRRTIIFASENVSTTDLEGLIRKETVSGRPSLSASSTSVHSLGNEQPPAVPKLPGSLSRGHISQPSQSSSFFDMYTTDQDYTITPHSNAEGSSAVPIGTASSPEEIPHGPAVEVLQLSNGEVIWSVLDSLRAVEGDDDSQSLFRRSMTSSRGHDGEEVEVRVKEHQRWDSNVSQGSLKSNPRWRQPANSTAARPETKLFKTDASTVGRLIEDLSRNMDAGSFNFQRHAPAASAAASFHSEASGSSHQVERELEALLNAINPRQGS